MKIFTKTTLAVVLMLCFAQLISAQTVNKGAWMVGGVAGFSSEKYKDADASFTFITIAPDLAYYIADDLAIGLSIGFYSSSFDGNSNSSFSVGPSIRYYFTDPIFVNVGANLGLDEGAGSAFYGAVGYSWFVNNSVAIEPMLFFTSYNEDDDDFDSSEFGLRIGVQAFLGRN